MDRKISEGAALSSIDFDLSNFIYYGADRIGNKL